MRINPIDVKERGIENGDMVSIFNDRGEVHIPAKVATVGFFLELSR
ncbi:hypothetical protein OK016_01890 [Vibrio chagasii]|nr:hypothetical protein [Vibrio chagasii]